VPRKGSFAGGTRLTITGRGKNLFDAYLVQHIPFMRLVHLLALTFENQPYPDYKVKALMGEIHKLTS